MNKPEKPAAGGTLRLAAKAAPAKKTLLADGTRRPSVRPKAPARARPQSEVMAERAQRAEREQRMERHQSAAPGGQPARPAGRPTAPGADRFAQGDRLPRRDAPTASRSPAPASGPRSAATPRAPGEGVRLNKRMADLGLCSRREADEWIARGWVRVNGQPAEMGQPVAPDALIEVAPQARHQQEQRVTILLHKPVGYVSGQPEDGHESAAVLVKAANQWQADPQRAQGPRWHDSHNRGLAPAGRLDIDSTGLLVLTQDGRVARTLIGEDSGVEKEYLVRVHWAPNGPQGAGVVAQDVRAAVPEDALQRLRHGLSLDDQPLKPAQVDWQNPEQLRFVLTEGKKRQIRRMCEQVGLHVVGLKRIRMGAVVLGNLPVGQWRYLRPGERF
jgi:23S rRNA pseudouridine2604 synthase